MNEERNGKEVFTTLEHTVSTVSGYVTIPFVIKKIIRA
jgi:hypothetical protein